MSKLRRKLSKWLLTWSYKLKSKDAQAEYNERLAKVHQFVYTYLPAMFVTEDGSALETIEGARYNYFTLPSGEIPQFQFVLPRFALYICVLDYKGANWEEARTYGVSREAWEAVQEDVKCIEENIPLLGTAGLPMRPKILVLRWEDPLGPTSLTRRVRELFGPVGD